MMKMITVFPVITEVRISVKAPSCFKIRQHRYRIIFKNGVINLDFTGYA